MISVSHLTKFYGDFLAVDDLSFSIDEGHVLPLDTERVDSYLSSMESLSLTDYAAYNAAEEDLAAYGLDDPELSVTVSYTPEDSGEAAEFTLHISRDPSERAQEDAQADDADGEEEEEITAYARVGES